MKYRKKILTVGVTGALLLNISGAVSPLNNTLADAQGTTTANTDQELQRAKDEAIKKLDEYPEAFAVLNNLANEAKKAKIKKINEATKKEDIENILNEVKNAHNLNKAKKEGKDFLDKLTHVSDSQKNDARNKIGSANKVENIIKELKDCLNKELDGYPYAFGNQLYGQKGNADAESQDGKDFSNETLSEAMKQFMKGKIYNDSHTKEDLEKILTTVKKADEIGKAKEEGRQKVDKMTNLSQEEKVKAYNSIGSGSTLEEVKQEEKKAEEKEAQEKAKKENAGKEQNTPPQDNGSGQQSKENEQGDQPSAPNAKDEAKDLEQAKEKAKKAIKELKNLTDEARNEYEEVINESTNEEELKAIQESAKGEDDYINSEKEQYKKRQAEANAELEKIKKYVKDASKEQIKKLNNLSQTQKDSLLKEVEKNTDVKDLEKVHKNAKTFDTKVKEAKEEIEKLKDLSEADKATYKEKIEKSENVEKVNENFGLATEKNNQILNEAKTKALDELKKLMNLTDDQLQKAKAEVLAGQDKKSVEKALSDAKVLDNKELTEARAKAKEEIEKLKDLKPEEKTKANSDITNSVTKKAINEVVEKAKKQDAKNKAEKVKPNEKPSGDAPQTPAPMPENPGENQNPQTPTPMP
ncbi:GA module-containing protein, partial [Gemelliphila asaccharolytica]